MRGRCCDTSSVSEWVRDLCGIYARSLLYKKHGVEKTWGYDNNGYINNESVCTDKRRTTTVYKALKEKGLIDNGYAWANYHVVHEKFLEIAPQYGISPEFSAEARKEKYSYSTEKEQVVNDPHERYLDLCRWSAETQHYIYIYFHQDEYIFQHSIEKKKRTVRHRGYYGMREQEYTEERLYVYPKEIASTLQKNIFDEKVKLAMHKRLPEVLGLFGQKVESISSDLKKYLTHHPWYFTPSNANEDWTLKELKERMNQTQVMLGHLQQTLTELGRYQELVKSFDTDGDFQGEAFRRYREHVIRTSPLYINDESKENADLRELADMIFKGNHEGIVEGYKEETVHA